MYVYVCINLLLHSSYFCRNRQRRKTSSFDELQREGIFLRVCGVMHFNGFVLPTPVVGLEDLFIVWFANAIK